MATNPQEVTVVNVTTTQQAKNILHDAKQDFVSKELRDPIIQKLNRNDTHYDDNNYVLDYFFYMRNNHIHSFPSSAFILNTPTRKANDSSSASSRGLLLSC